MKVAKLVYVTIATRVIVEEGANQQTIMEEAIPRLSENLMDSPYENLEKIVDDTECPYEIGEEYSLSVGDDILMPDPKDDCTDSWQYGDFIGRIVAFKEFDNVIYATVEDGDNECFDIEAERIQDRKEL